MITVVVSPLLDLAGFYQPPFFVKTEVSTTLEVADEANSVAIHSFGMVTNGREVLFLKCDRAFC